MASNLIFDGDASKYQEGDPLLKLSQEKRAYVEEVAYYAQQEYSRRVAAGEDWVLPEVAVSQAILETGWGQHRGANDFGIKAWSGSNRSKTTLATKEQNADGSYYGTNAAFEQTSSIEDSVSLYYDFITSNSRYSKALNLTDPYQSIREIQAAGYATSHSYADNLISIVKNYNLSRFSTSTVTSFEYSEKGYIEGVEAYEEAQKIITNLETSIDSSENKIKISCSSKPQIDYESIIELKKIKEIVSTMKDLLFKIKGIADRQKYIAEQYNVDNGSLSILQAASLSLGTVNYSFDNNEEFIQLVNDFKTNGSSEQIFSTWFQSYVSTKGIASSIVDMNQYKKSIKTTYASTSDNYVVSKASEVLQSESKITTKTATNTTSQQRTNKNYPNSVTQFTTQTNSYQANKNVSSSQNHITINNSPTKNKQDVSNIIRSFIKTTTTPEVPSTPTPDISINHSPTDILINNNTTIDKIHTSNSTTKSIQSQQTSLLQPGFISNDKKISSTIKDITSLITPGTTQPENSLPDPEIPTESTITEIIPGTTNENENLINRPKQTTDNSPQALTIGLGIGTTAIGVGAGAYYVNKKRKENNNTSDYTDENDEYYQDDYYEEEQNLFKESKNENSSEYDDDYE